jgi:hypothetical protein
MTNATRFAVFLFPQAIEVLGEAIKPYLTDSPMGQHVVCSAVDASGGFFQLTVPGCDQGGNEIAAELMVPNAMIKLVASMHDEHAFGFGGRN